jgi:hypothetical protein
MGQQGQQRLGSDSRAMVGSTISAATRRRATCRAFDNNDDADLVNDLDGDVGGDVGGDFGGGDSA